MSTFIFLAMSLVTIALNIFILASDPSLPMLIIAIVCIFAAVGSGTLILGARR